MNILLPELRANARAAVLVVLALLTLFLAFIGPAHAQEDPPGRVGRLADIAGSVSWWDDETGQWADAERNRPLTGGDRIATARDGRVELRIGSTTLRLAVNTELEVLRLDDERLVFQLHAGSLALRVRSREVADEIEVITAETRLLPQRAGHYRIDRVGDVTQAASWRGTLRVGDDGGPLIVEGQRAELFRDARRDGSGGLRLNWIAMPGDGFTDWVMTEDQRDERRSQAQAYVSPEMTGAEDLDRYGRWEQHPDYGALWLPMQVTADWAPYRYGRWSWVAPWGWTWIDDAPWGFAPFHYGRWVSWRGRWGWVPGAYVARPVYAPALVAWVGGGSWGASIQIGGPTVGWVPLAPREVYRPHYRTTPRYIERVNPNPPYRWRHPPGQVPTGPISYGNQGVPNAVTVVPRDVLTRRQPVARGVVELPRDARPGPRAPLAVLPPPPAPERARTDRRPPPGHVPPREPIGSVQPVPGGAQRFPGPTVMPVPESRPQRPQLPASRDERRDERIDRRDDRRDERGDDRRDDRRDGPRGDARNGGRDSAPREVIDLRQPRPGPQPPAGNVAPPAAAVQPPAVVPPPAAAPPPTRERDATPPQRGGRPERGTRDERGSREQPQAQPQPQPQPQPQQQVQPQRGPQAAPRPVPAPAPAAAPAPAPAPAPAAAPPAPPRRESLPDRPRPGDRERDRNR
ncbi:MAG: hypothetical protein Q7U73_20460 [Rubrivivax sp.]|nr:hypothetical protein [Rubrivivax sp.]